MVDKAVKENWSRDKARAIKQAVKERPLRTKQILSQDYSDPYEGSSQWKQRLEVAKSDVDLAEIKELDSTREHMQGAVDAFDRIIEHGLKMKAAMDKFDFTEVTPLTREKLHKTLLKFVPFAYGYMHELEEYMIKKGELETAWDDTMDNIDQRVIKEKSQELLKGGK